MAAKPHHGLLIVTQLPGSFTHVRIRKGQSLAHASRSHTTPLAFEQRYLEGVLKEGLIATPRQIKRGFRYKPKSPTILSYSTPPRNDFDSKVRYPLSAPLTSDDRTVMGECHSKEPFEHVFTRVKSDLWVLHEKGMEHGFRDPFFEEFYQEDADLYGAH